MADCVGAQRTCPEPQVLGAAPLRSSHRLPPRVKPGSLGAIIRSFKSTSTKRASLLSGNPGSTLWQWNYYEHIIRDERELQSFRKYISENPPRWSLDEENPAPGCP